MFYFPEEINGCVQVHSQGRVEGLKLSPFGGINHSTNLEGCAESFPEIAFMNPSEISSLAMKNREHLRLDIWKVQNLGGCSPSILEVGSIYGTPKKIMDVDADGEQNLVTNHALGGILDMGLGCELTKEVCEMVSCSNHNISWARRVDMENGNIDAFAHESDSEPEQVNLFSELQDQRFRRKYVSITELQDKYLSVKEKRKRDRAMKKSKEVGKENVSFELVDYSPSDSDIARMQKLTISVRKTLELGKKLGMEIISDEEEVLAGCCWI
ncbi:hypothetical protein V6N13_125690 [Hibiscus sabdariffa]|uniref:Uncharacterized protein n=1 Tax=Hibiscus sabdariffa TaxID=183260 RepID=A0ABR2U6I3_9ROSI